MVIVGLAGKAGTGKSTLAYAAAAALPDGAIGRVRSFAFPIYAMLSVLQSQLGLPRTMRKEEVLHNGVTVRRALQTLGTEWGRNMIGEALWVACMEQEYKTLCEEYEGGVLFIDDVRFPNEVGWIHSQGGIVVALTRESATQTAPAHASEQFEVIASLPGVISHELDERLSRGEQLDRFIDLIKEYTWA